MDTQKKIQLEEKLKTAASTGSKAHVIAKDGHWAIFKEGSSRVTATYSNRRAAISNAKKILLEGKVNTLVVHKKDGSVFSVESLKDYAV